MNVSIRNRLSVSFIVGCLVTLWGSPSVCGQTRVSEMEDYSVEALIDLSLSGDGQWLTSSAIETFLETQKIELGNQLKQDRMQVEQLRQQLNELEELLNQRRELEFAVTATALRAGVSADSIDERLSQLNDQILQMQVELKGQEVRRTISIEQLRELQAQNDANVNSDPLLEELDKILALERKSLLRAKQLYDQAVASEQEVSKAERGVAEVQMRVIERRQELKDSSRDPRIELLNNDILNSTLSIGELKAKVGELQKATDALKDVRERINQLKQASSAVSVDEAAVSALRLEELELERQMFRTEIAHDRVQQWSKKFQELKATQAEEKKN